MYTCSTLAHDEKDWRGAGPRGSPAPTQKALRIEVPRIEHTTELTTVRSTRYLRMTCIKIEIDAEITFKKRIVQHFFETHIIILSYSSLFR